MSEFEKFWKDYDQDGDLGAPTHSENDKILAEAIWDHQQKIIDLQDEIIERLNLLGYYNKTGWGKKAIETEKELAPLRAKLKGLRE